MGKLFGVKSHWELIVWYLINLCITKKHCDFKLSDIVEKNNVFGKYYKILEYFDHKKDPHAQKATIRNTVNKMRKKGWIERIGRGEYKVTDSGYNELSSQEKSIEMVQTIVGGLMNAKKDSES